MRHCEAHDGIPSSRVFYMGLELSAPTTGADMRSNLGDHVERFRHDPRAARGGALVEGSRAIFSGGACRTDGQAYGSNEP